MPDPRASICPPAALTANPPKLPLFVLMMGQPGLPDPQYVSAALDEFAARNNGLAPPIAIVADQIGPDQNDTLCLDTAKYGNVEKYINEDVVNWAKANLNILPDREHWTIAGYSNGGQCAISFAVKYPQMWGGNVVDISGEEFPGAEDPAGNLAAIFNGNQAAYDAQKPINIMKGRQFPPNTTAVFTVGSDDTTYVAAAKAVSAAARDAGMTVTYYEVPNGGHVGLALNAGLTKGFEVLYPSWACPSRPYPFPAHARAIKLRCATLARAAAATGTVAASDERILPLWWDRLCSVTSPPVGRPLRRRALYRRPSPPYCPVVQPGNGRRAPGSAGDLT